MAAARRAAKGDIRSEEPLTTNQDSMLADADLHVRMDAHSLEPHTTFDVQF